MMYHLKGMKMMPVYEYKCLTCEKIFDALRKMDEMDQKISCPHCGNNETKRQLSVFGVGSSRHSSGNVSKSTPPSCGGG